MKKNFVVTIDLSGMPCPAPLLRAKKILDDLDAGESMCLISDCPGTHDDLLAWSRSTRNIFVSATKQKGGAVAYHLCKAGEAQTFPVPDVTLDVRGTPCPRPILEASQRLEGMRCGEVLQLVTDCSEASEEIPLWSHTNSIDFLFALELPDGVKQFYLQKR